MKIHTPAGFTVELEEGDDVASVLAALGGTPAAVPAKAPKETPQPPATARTSPRTYTNRGHWTDAELAIAANPNLSNYYVASRVKRTLQAVETKRWELRRDGVLPPSKNRRPSGGVGYPWTEEEDTRIRVLWPLPTEAPSRAEINSMLSEFQSPHPRTADAIYSRWRKTVKGA